MQLQTQTISGCLIRLKVFWFIIGKFGSQQVKKKKKRFHAANE